MKANQLLRIPIGICITAGAVIAFVPRSATSLHRSEIFSANNNDLTSLLGTTKYDIETGKQFAKTVSSKIPDTVITNPVPAIETPADVIKTYSSLKSSPLLEVTRVEDDKVFPLGSFIKSTLTVENTGSAPADSSSWDTAVANFGILTDNFLGLFGTTIPLGSDTAPAYLKNVPEEVKPWLVLITGTTLAIIGSSASKKASLIVTTDNTKSIQASSDAIDSLSNELVRNILLYIYSTCIYLTCAYYRYYILRVFSLFFHSLLGYLFMMVSIVTGVASKSYEVA